MGVPINLPKVSPQPHTNLAFEGYQFAKERGKGNAYNHRVLEAFFVEGRDIGDIEVLTKLAGEVGLDQKEYGEALRTRRYREAHREALRHAYEEAGVTIRAGCLLAFALAAGCSDRNAPVTKSPGLAASTHGATGEVSRPEPRTMLIEPGELQQKLKQPRLRILDIRPQADYAQGHIPGAIPVDVKSWQELGRKEGGFHDAKAWGEKVGQLGIGHDSPVVVYGSNPTDTARVWWTLKYLGVRDVAILNGGWQLWVKEKHPTDTSSPNVEVVKFVPQFQADHLEEIDSLKKSIKSDKVTVVDVRSAEEFTGKEVRGERGGHIPGAKHLEWKELVSEDGRFKSPEALRELFRQRGIHPEQTAITC